MGDCPLEFVVLHEYGKPQFEPLRRRALTTKPFAVRQAAVRQRAAIFAFDLQVLRGRDLRPLPLLKRKKAL